MASRFLLWVLCCQVTLWSVGNSSHSDKVANTNPMDRRVLDFLYNVTYDTYHEHANWTGWGNSSSDPCIDEWYGIQYLRIHRRVLRLLCIRDRPAQSSAANLTGRTDRNEVPKVADIKWQLFSVKSSLRNICNAVAGIPGH